MHPNPNELYPIPASSRTAFLKNIIKNPNIIVGLDFGQQYINWSKYDKGLCISLK